MKIAIVLPGGVDRSGTHRVIPCILWLIERLAADHDVHVIALEQEARTGEWSLLGARVVNIGGRGRRLRALAALWAEHARAPFDVVHSFWAAGPGLVGAMFRGITGIGHVLTLPGGDIAAVSGIGYGARLGWRGRLLVHLAMKGADRLVAPSAWMAREAQALGFAARMIPFGVARDLWPPMAPRRRQTGAPLRLIHVANLNRVKDQETLLLALAHLRADGVAFRMEVIGSDTLGGVVQARAAALGLQDVVRFHGFLPQAAMRPWLEGADLLVMSSRHEVGPVVMVEAAMVGVPMVGTAVGRMADWSPEAALTVPVGEDVAMARAIAGLARDEGARLSLARRAQDLALAQDADFTAAATIALYREVMREIAAG
jgi:glycosyltransferase involved in cell wall biosynthesis